MSAEHATRLASLLAMMADPMRARILYALDTVDELCVGDLVLVLGASQDAVGYALRMLRTAGLVVNRRAGESSTTASQTTSRHRCESTAFAAWSISPAPTTAISA